MNNTYRDIFKWGDKREEKVDNHMLKIIKEKFDLKDDDLKAKYLPGIQTVKIDKESSLKPQQIEFFRGLTGEDNVLSDDSRGQNSHVVNFMLNFLT